MHIFSAFFFCLGLFVQAILWGSNNFPFLKEGDSPRHKCRHSQRRRGRRRASSSVAGRRQASSGHAALAAERPLPGFREPRRRVSSEAHQSRGANELRSNEEGGRWSGTGSPAARAAATTRASKYSRQPQTIGKEEEGKKRCGKWGKKKKRTNGESLAPR